MPQIDYPENPSLGEIYSFGDRSWKWDGRAWRAYTEVVIPGGEEPYSGASPTTTQVGGLIAGSEIAGLTISEILEDILVPYVAPSFSSFSVAQSTPLEVGQTLTGNRSFSFTILQGGNVQANSVSIRDVTSNSVLASGIGVNSSPVSAPIGTVQRTSPGTYSWRAQATNTQLGVFQSTSATVQWRWRAYSGTSESNTLDEVGIKLLSSSSLVDSEVGTYSFGSGGYKYFAWPDSFGSPSPEVGFRDISTSFPISMANSSDDNFFSEEENGWSYGLVEVTNVHGISTNYRVYRTKNVLGGSISIQVS